MSCAMFRDFLPFGFSPHARADATVRRARHLVRPGRLLGTRPVGSAQRRTELEA